MVNSRFSERPWRGGEGEREGVGDRDRETESERETILAEDPGLVPSTCLIHENL